MSARRQAFVSTRSSAARVHSLLIADRARGRLIAPEKIFLAAVVVVSLGLLALAIAFPGGAYPEAMMFLPP